MPPCGRRTTRSWFPSSRGAGLELDGPRLAGHRDVQVAVAHEPRVGRRERAQPVAVDRSRRTRHARRGERAEAQRLRVDGVGSHHAVAVGLAADAAVGTELEEVAGRVCRTRGVPVRPLDGDEPPGEPGDGRRLPGGRAALRRSRPQATSMRTHAPRARALTWHLLDRKHPPSTTDAGAAEHPTTTSSNRHTEFLVTATGRQL